MSSTIDRLRRLNRLRPKRQSEEPPLPPPKSPSTSDKSRPSIQLPRLEEIISGQEIRNKAGTCYLHTRTYPLHHLLADHENRPINIGDILVHRPNTYAPFHANFGLEEHHSFRHAAFIDTETTGLGGGAGVYCFMVGVGLFDQNTEQFIVHQLFMRNPAEESALLLCLAELLQHATMTVTFNGRAFDLALLRIRLSQHPTLLAEQHSLHQLLTPDNAHLDLLMPARRLWRRRLGSCRLVNLEEAILGLERSQDDVPGHLIPALYTDYVRTNNASQMGNVFYHNHQDILTMVALAHRQCEVLAKSPAIQHCEAQPGLDWLALGQWYEMLGKAEEAERAYDHALKRIREPDAQADLFRCLGQLQKRQGAWDAATGTWQRWLTSVPGNEPTPYVELAKYCEWQAKDLEQAKMWTQWALHNLATLPHYQQHQWLTQIRALEHRLARLERKLS